MAATAYTLKHPTRDLAALNIREPKVKDLEAVEVAASRPHGTRIGVVKTMIACLADVPLALIDELHHEDFEEAGRIAGAFSSSRRAVRERSGAVDLLARCGGWTGVRVRAARAIATPIDTIGEQSPEQLMTWLATLPAEALEMQA